MSAKLVARPYEPPLRGRQEEFSLFDYVRSKLSGEDTDNVRRTRRLVEGLNDDAKPTARAGQYVPLSVLGQRDINVGTDPQGGYLMGTQTRPQDFIEALHPVSLAARLGVMSLSGLIQNAALPKGTAAAVTYWLGEDGEPAESAVTFGAVTASPHTVGALLPPISRNLLLFGTREAVEPILKRLLLRAIASAIDTALFAGSGVDGQPLGILFTPEIDTRSGATFALATATGMLKVLEDAHLPTENGAWIMDPATAKILRERPKVATGDIMLLGDDNRLCGRSAFVSASIPSGTLLLGNFEEGAAIASWGPSIEVLVDSMTLSKQGLVRIIAFASIDVFVRQLGAFAIATEVS